MSDRTISDRPRRDERQRLPMAFSRPRSNGPSAVLLGATCVLLGAACIAVTFWNSDLAVQSGALLLGMSLGASGIIAFLAGDR